LAWATMRLVLSAAGPAACAVLGAPVRVAIITFAVAHIVGYAPVRSLPPRGPDRRRRALHGGVVRDVADGSRCDREDVWTLRR
jgi:hypothetical protein